MPTSLENSFSLQDFHVVRCKNNSGKIEVLAQFQGGRPSSCPHCQSRSRFRVKDHSERSFRHTTVGHKVVHVRAGIKKWLCVSCKRTFSDRIPGVLPRRRASEKFRKQIYTDHEQGVSKKDLSRRTGISDSTVERWYQDFLAYRMRELSGRKCPIVLGIDEHFFSRKHGFATTLVDLKNHKVFDVKLGRSKASLGSYLRRLPGRERVRVIVMDLSATYRSIAEAYFPNAKIVADRFHVIRLIEDHFTKLWRDLDPERSKNRGLTSLMRRHQKNLSYEQEVRLRNYLKSVPGLEVLYDFKSHLLTLMRIKRINRKQAIARIPEFLDCIDALRGSPFVRLQTLGETLNDWREPIVRMWRFSKSNGITEGFHNKMELISRRAYGFRNFENYRIRVIALCGWDGVFKPRN